MRDSDGQYPYSIVCLSVSLLFPTFGGNCIHTRLRSFGLFTLFRWSQKWEDEYDFKSCL